MGSVGRFAGFLVFPGRSGFQVAIPDFDWHPAGAPAREIPWLDALPDTSDRFGTPYCAAHPGLRRPEHRHTPESLRQGVRSARPGPGGAQAPQTPQAPQVPQARGEWQRWGIQYAAIVEWTPGAWQRWWEGSQVADGGSTGRSISDGGSHDGHRYANASVTDPPGPATPGPAQAQPERNRTVRHGIVQVARTWYQAQAARAVEQGGRDWYRNHSQGGRAAQNGWWPRSSDWLDRPRYDPPPGTGHPQGASSSSSGPWQQQLFAEPLVQQVLSMAGQQQESLLATVPAAGSNRGPGAAASMTLTSQEPGTGSSTNGEPGTASSSSGRAGSLSE